MGSIKSKPYKMDCKKLLQAKHWSGNYFHVYEQEAMPQWLFSLLFVSVLASQLKYFTSKMWTHR